MQRVSSRAAIARFAAAIVVAGLSVAAVMMAGRAGAVEGVSVELGGSTSSLTDLQVSRLGVQWKWNQRLLESGGGYLGGYWDFSVGYWRNESDPRLRTSSSLLDIGLTPTLRWTQPWRPALAGFVDFGIGLHWLSEDSITTLRDLSSPVQFGSVLGVGLQFGTGGEYELGYRVQHLSNGGLQQPNSGINLQLIRFQYHF
jgi:lipid A 3-O-deacylase